ncbi:MAG: DUF1565 domain-containing protein [Turneriella sp.]
MKRGLRWPMVSLYVMTLLLASSCSSITTSNELLEANFLAKGQAPIDLLSPTENQQVNTANPTFSWSSRGVNLYTIEIASDSKFVTPVLSKEITGTSYTLANADLMSGTAIATNTYYWRVKVSRLADNLESKIGSFFLIAIPANGSGYAGALHVNGSSLADIQVGSKAAPFKTISNAIQVADALRNGRHTVSVDLVVAGGVYTEEIFLVPGISIRGGYESTNWTRNISTNATIIQAPIDTAIRGGAGVTQAYTPTTVVEGFSIRGAPSVTGYGIYLNNSSPTIKSNDIIGGDGSSSSYGIYNTAASPVISGNVIKSGNSSNSSTYGIYNSSSSPTIVMNTISTGSVLTGNNHVIYNNDSSPIISNNIIIGGASNGNSAAVYNSQSSSPTILNNTIIAGITSGTTHYGIYMYPLTGTPVSEPSIQNNIIYVPGKTAVRAAIWENSTHANPTAVKNNAFFDLGSSGNFYSYRDGDGVCNGGASNYCASIGDLEADLNSELSSSASGNVNESAVFANFPFKIDITQDGPDAGGAYAGTASSLEVANCVDYNLNEYFEYDRDGIARQILSCSTATGSGVVSFSPALAGPSATNRELRLWGINGTNFTLDFHLNPTTACNIREGGIDLSTFLASDRDGAVRTATLTCGPTNSGAIGWTVGAYEF